MAQNTLKQKARLFAQKHGLPYATALRAVDEPLHELRRLLNTHDRDFAAIHPHLRLTGERSIYDPAFPAASQSDWPRREYDRLIIESNLSRFQSPNDFLKELGRRLTLIESVKTRDIWTYRELYRAGLLEEGMPNIEPFFHHFATKLPWGFDPVFIRGPYVGIYGVSIASFLHYSGPISLIPITESNFEALKEGRSVGEIKLPPIHRLNSLTDSVKESGLKFSSAAFYFEPNTDGTPLLTILFKEDPEVSGVDIEALGLSPKDFFTYDLDRKPVEIIRSWDMVKFSIDATSYEGCSDRLLEL